MHSRRQARLPESLTAIFAVGEIEPWLVDAVVILGIDNQQAEVERAHADLNALPTSGPIARKSYRHLCCWRDRALACRCGCNPWDRQSAGRSRTGACRSECTPDVRPDCPKVLPPSLLLAR